MLPKKAKKSSGQERRVSWQYRLFLIICAIIVVAMIISLIFTP
jgi:hypothetical protein